MTPAYDPTGEAPNQIAKAFEDCVREALHHSEESLPGGWLHFKSEHPGHVDWNSLSRPLDEMLSQFEENYVTIPPQEVRAWDLTPAWAVQDGMRRVIQRVGHVSRPEGRDRAIRDVSREFREFLTCASLDLTLIAPLRNLALLPSHDSQPNMDFGTVFDLRLEFTPDEDDRFNLGEDPPTRCVQGSVEILKRPGTPASFDGRPCEEALDTVWHLLHAFQIVIPEPVGIDLVNIRPDGYFPLLGPFIAYPGESVPEWPSFLQPADLGIIKTTFQALLDQPHPAIALAGRRLARSNGRYSLEDQVLDIGVGLEALLLCGQQDRTEVNYRLALHFAALFIDPSEREAAFKLAKAFYQVRSTVAHGAEVRARDLNRVIEAAAFFSTEAHRKTSFRVSRTMGWIDTELARRRDPAGDSSPPRELDDSARRQRFVDVARSMLRFCFLYFIRNAKKPEFQGDDFWRRALFGQHTITDRPGEHPE